MLRQRRSSLTIEKFACSYSVSAMAVTLNQLSSFLAVAREGSVSAAAEKLFVTQPSISAAVSALSRELGVDLTERVGRGVGLTAAGQAFRPYAADVLGLVEQGRQAAREAADLSMRSLRLVAVATAAEYVVPALLRSFARAAPRDPSLARGREPRDGLRAGARARGRRRDRRPSARGRAHRRLRVPAQRARADRGSRRRAGRADGTVAPRELGDRVWLQRESGSGTRQLLAEFFAEHDLRPQTLTLGSNGAIKEAVRLGLGVSLQSRVAVEQELASGHARRAEGEGRACPSGSGTRSTRRPCRRDRRSSSSSSTSTAPTAAARSRSRPHEP